MSLSENSIKANATTAAFRKGKALAVNGDVFDLQVDRDEENGILFLNGKVRGNEQPYYEVSVDLDTFRDYETTQTRCKCEANRTIPGYCKHIVALQLAYIEKERQEKKEAVRNKKDMEIFDKKTKEDYPLVNDFIEFLQDVEKIQKNREQSGKRNSADAFAMGQNMREQAKKNQETREEQLRRLLGMGTVKKGVKPKQLQTDATINRILDRMAQNVQNRMSGSVKVEDAVELEPQIYKNYGYGPFMLSFKIGGKKKYVIKSLEEFVELMEKRENFSYGKNLTFVHARENFAKHSIPLLDFILELVHMRNQQQRSFYRAPRTKEVVLNPLLFERLMLAIEESEALIQSKTTGISFTAIDGGNQGDMYYLQQRDPDMDVSLEKAEGGAFLQFPKMDIMLGSTEVFLVDHNMIYHCSDEFSEDMRIILEQLSVGEAQELFISDKDMQSVCAVIIPPIAKHFHLEEKNISVEAYEPPEAEFFLYLDDEPEIGITCRVECKYGEEKYRIFQETDNSVYRDFPRENGLIKALEKYFVMARRKGSDFMITEDDKLYELLLDGIDELNQLATVYASENFRKNGIRQTPAVELGVSIKSELLDLSIQSEQLPYAELDEILNSYKLRKRYHRLKDGQFLELEDSALSVISELADGLEISGKDLKRGKIRLPKHRALFIDAVLKDAGEHMHVHRDNLFRGLIRNIKNVEDSDYEIPQRQQPILRSYQKKGYRWLRTIREYGFGGILADDMGLGKTLQMITLFQAIKEERESLAEKPDNTLALVVCPASLVYNWENEIKKFAPDMTTQVISGSAAVRKGLMKEGKDKDVWITSYDLLKRDVEQYENYHFEVHVIDEAQYIKNAQTQAAKAVKAVSSNTRFALTGTPIENRLSELWSIFDFLMPGLLFSYKHFKEELETIIVQGEDGETSNNKAVSRLKNMVRPFILRRLKEDVLKDLPKKLENVVYSNMEGEQRKLYDARVQNLKNSLEHQTNDEFKNNKIEILAELTRLRQICCDPSLCYEDYKGDSAKLETCMEMIEDAVNSGHKILVFSQFTTMLERIGKELKKKKIAFYELTGETKKERRVEMAKAFNENEVPIFLISLRAGGTGLNLVGADMVIHFDPWWNLAAQNQATDRAHRIGQKKVVTVFKMITAKSIEEKILDLQEKKKNLADQIISDEGMSESKLSREELLEILSN